MTFDVFLSKVKYEDDKNVYKIRPVLISKESNDKFVYVYRITSSKPLKHNKCKINYLQDAGLTKESYIITDFVYKISKTNILKKIGHLNNYDVGKFLDTILNIHHKEISLEGLNEAISNLTDIIVLGYIKDCIDFLNKNGYNIDINEITFKQSSNKNALGKMIVEAKDKYSFNFTLVLSKYLIDTSDEKEIKGIIYHELCHYLTDKEAILKHYLLIDDYLRLVSNEKYKDYVGHGKIWKQYASNVGRLTGYNITRLATKEDNPKFYNELKNNSKYILKCANCGAVYTFNRKNNFLNSLYIIDKSKHMYESIAYAHPCSDGTKCNKFEFIKGEF